MKNTDQHIQRVAIVAGLRSPFCKQGTAFASLSAEDLACAVVKELITRSDLHPEQIDNLVFGQVLPRPGAPNIGRELVLRLDLPRRIPGSTVMRACASSAEALFVAADAIALGRSQVAIAGGVELLSDLPVMFSRGFADIMLAASQAKSSAARLKAFAGLRPKDLTPQTPSISESSTGMSMGEHAEAMARQNGISRDEQDAFAARSHQLALAAIDDGRVAQEIAPIFVPETGNLVETDMHPRRDTSLDALAQLKPVFDKDFGSVTAGNSCPVTDGAAALLLMSEARARELNMPVLAWIGAHAVSAVDPDWQLLMAPSLAISTALDRQGLSLAGIDLFDMHEAFAAQVISNLRALASDDFAKEHLHKKRAIGEVNMARFNVMGGSIALGHPFAATAARQIISASNELRRRGGRFALVSQCAAGGMGAALVLHNPEVSA